MQHIVSPLHVLDDRTSIDILGHHATIERWALPGVPTPVAWIHRVALADGDVLAMEDTDVAAITTATAVLGRRLDDARRSA